MRIRGSLAGLAIALAFASCIPGCNAAAEIGSSRLSSTDAATADGSVRAGLRNGEVYAVLTGTDHSVVLSPDSWSTDDESTNWTKWLVDFDNAIFAQWMKSQPGEGQQTVRFRIGIGTIQTNPGTYFSPSASKSDSSKFLSAVTGSMQQALAGMSAMPVTKNPLKEIRYVATFMCAARTVPVCGREQLGFMVVPTPPGDNITVFGRLKEGRAPGIQIMSENGGGDIKVTDDAAFLQNCREQDAAKQ